MDKPVSLEWAIPAVMDCSIDAWQRNPLFRDVIRERGNQFVEHERAGKPSMPGFDCGVRMDTRHTRARAKD